MPDEVFICRKAKLIETKAAPAADKPCWNDTPMQTAQCRAVGVCKAPPHLNEFLLELITGHAFDQYPKCYPKRCIAVIRSKLEKLRVLKRHFSV